MALSVADAIEPETSLAISAQGALVLMAAVIAGRRNDRKAADALLRRAQFLADALGEDANHGGTAFGPTNVAIHRVSVAAELGDADSAIVHAEQLDTSTLPAILHSRRA